ncbi:MAG: undecaprenyldiphospho-muramoylpentapeptide beta-N-acetylglucosaminyltransferase [Bacteroidaceae bacterium]|nr:undecaprenyldiphospho-muramoylpentapeptide beta-N-acetylglucosaminyltransferase [Bacteroidaceae bacterium]
MEKNRPYRVIISGGGTGGHIFPALSIAGALQKLQPDIKLLFVGAEGRMEMTRVPAAGYEIKGLPVAGFDRQHLWKNVSVLWKLLKSRRMAKKIIKEFQPDVAVGVGGYASGPTLNMAEAMGIPTLLQEQNSFAGVTNKLLAKKATTICVAYDGMERFFPKEKIMFTGNPVRQQLMDCELSRAAAINKLGFDPVREVVLIVGGSLGARTINESVLSQLETISKSKVQILWQTGGYYFQEICERLKAAGCPSNLKVTDFISHMDEAYRAADLVVSRAGASSISELCLLGKPSILVPSPNVAEDHQTHNAMALVNKDAALLVRDADAIEQLIPKALETASDLNRLKQLGANAKALGKADAAETIAREVLRLADTQH